VVGFGGIRCAAIDSPPARELPPLRFMAARLRPAMRHLQQGPGTTPFGDAAVKVATGTVSCTGVARRLHE
jgi:hypothetical protein